MLVVSMLFFITSCGKNMSSVVKAPQNLFVKPSQSSILRTIGINNDSTESTSGVSLVLFASYTCGACKKEQKHLEEYIHGYNLNIDIYTVLISVETSNKGAINNFKESIGFSWPMMLDPKMKAFKTLCRGDQTPCIVAVNKDDQVLFSHTGGLEITEIEKMMKTKIRGGLRTDKPKGTIPPIGPITIPTIPAPPSNQMEFQETLSLIDTDGLVTQESIDSASATKPLIVLFSSYMCLTCEEENKELALELKNGNPLLKDANIITSYFLPMSSDINSTVAKAEIDKFRSRTQIPWKMTLDSMNQTTFKMELFSKYVQDPNGFKVPPGTAIFIPGKGRVFHKEGAHVADILDELEKHHAPAQSTLHFNENLDLIQKDGTVSSQTFDSSQLTKPLVVLFSSFMCLTCEEENKEMAEALARGVPELVNAEIITTYFLPMTSDIHSEVAGNEIEKFRAKTHVPWKIALDEMDQSTFKLRMFTKYVQSPGGFNVPPGTAIFIPSQGRVFHKEGASTQEIINELKKY